MQMQFIIIAVIIYILAVWWFSLTFGLNPILQFTNSAIKHNLGFNKSKVLSVTAPLIIYEQAHQRTKIMPLYLASPFLITKFLRTLVNLYNRMQQTLTAYTTTMAEAIYIMVLSQRQASQMRSHLHCRFHPHDGLHLLQLLHHHHDPCL